MGQRLKAKLLKVLEDVLRRPVIDGVTIRKEDHSVEHHEDFGGRLVDRGNDGLSPICLCSKQLDCLC